MMGKHEETPKNKPCPVCGGSGKVNNGKTSCGACGGSGRI